jgi:hypothetical protein
VRKTGTGQWSQRRTVFLIFAEGDPEQAGHQIFICRIVSEGYVTED